ncbi:MULTISPECIES: alanine/glycine:cation symporter family protein [Lysinibacillus]|jgi:AGCS family alanine or glycine:cation symporter|uniref:Alanine:cation symporter family protein n=1 Tax=Lysinibacillus fusiformis TaxID=28031 RepID=A0A2I0UY68_9BACI|nr:MULTISPECIES: alanine/glycine:cation symporter family protein [Lysinibacillus]KUF29802.1 sodium:alanine symporter [Lysinibacillus sp. F5]MEE3809623.1 alanine/glycine:cation symporter family protein [Lysinibacillus fusiformis]PKU51015.1 alanine:cation symporter family protein [Lysinibacillus fusiformis]SCY18924.1 alanine or glycine:cation symporter, AGCS family [Lysinibacillus sp. SG9]SDB10501.1 alanine or glycine:cation symporter, AGCS family [Lysinibacillus sp. TC-37]
MEWISSIVNSGNNVLWTYILIILLIVAGLYFSFGTKFVQIRLFPEMFRLIVEKREGESGVSPFQAFTISAASRVGTGNITGVALAIGVGGPGAVFWMWIIAILGMATAFIESTLAQVYKVKDGNTFRGGPAYYMEKALGQRKLGIIFSILLTFSFGFIFNAVQSNTIATSVGEAFDIKPAIIGIILVALTALIIFGGVHRIVKVTQILVPVMAIFYLLVALFVVVTNFSEIPHVFNLIFTHAFGLQEAAGGAIGAAIMQGVRRGLFSNEAGMGSVPNAAATANTSHPAKQGLVQSLGVFFDTIMICTATAFIIILAGLYDKGESDGIILTQNSLAVQVGDWAPYFIAIAIIFFAFSSIIGNYYYGESNIEFMDAHKGWMFSYRILVLAMVMFGSVAQVQLVWNLADLFMGLMALINIAIIIILGKIAFLVLDDFTQQRKAGKNPVFYAKSIPTLKNTDCWEEDR